MKIDSRGAPRRYVSTARWTAALLFAALLLPLVLTQLPRARAGGTTQPFAIKVTNVACVSDCDGEGLEGLFNGQPEFYAKIWLNGYEHKTADHSGTDIQPNWVVRQDVPASATHVDVAMQIWDGDDTSGDDLADITQNPGRAGDDRGANLEFRVDPTTGTYRGDVTSPVRCSQGNGDAGGDVDVKVCFQLEFERSLRNVRVHAVLLADDNGGGRVNINPQEIATWLDAANQMLSVAGVRLTFDPDPRSGDVSTLDSTLLNNMKGRDDPNWAEATAAGNDVAARHRGRLVILFRFGANGGGFSAADLNFVAMPGFNSTTVCDHQNIGLLGHEVGHYLGLDHTFAQEFNSVAEARDYFVARGRDPSVFDGDKLSDTPPDPHIRYSCNPGPVLSLDGTDFPLPRDNVMAYHDWPVKTMTPQQVDIVRAKLADRAAQQGLEVRANLGSSLDGEPIGSSASGLGIEPAAPAPAPPPMKRPTSTTTTTTAKVETVVTAAPPLANLGELSARLTRRDNGTPLAGQTIVMSTSSGPVCQGITDADGRARCTALWALVQIGLENGYTAAYPGAGHLLSTSARTALLAGAAAAPTTARPQATAKPTAPTTVLANTTVLPSSRVPSSTVAATATVPADPLTTVTIPVTAPPLPVGSENTLEHAAPSVDRSPAALSHEPAAWPLALPAVLLAVVFPIAVFATARRE